jgi:segregation and condensation protein B
MSNLQVKIEAVLFFKGEPISVKKLSALCKSSEADVGTALDSLEKNLSGRGIRLMRKENEVMLATAPELTDLITDITKEELSRDLGRAGLETLSIVLYRGPISRKEIDYIRGVNSTFILRNLLVRGLVERVHSDKDERVFLYKATFDLLSHLGVSRLEELPEYERVKQEEHYKTLEEESEKKTKNVES